MAAYRKSYPVVGKRHRAIIAEYDRLMTQEKTDNPIRARYLSNQYYIHRIAKDPRLGLGMTENYITKVINNRRRYEQG